MNSNRLLQKISSKYIFQIIFHYIEDNIIPMKIIFYSKYFQKKLDLSIFDYQKIYFKNIGFNIKKYLSNFSTDSEIKYNDKELLIKKFNEDLLKYKINVNDINKYVMNYFQKVDVKDNIDYYKYIDVYSPFFDIISKSKIFEKYFIIPISIELIKNYELKNDYIRAFKRLNELKIKYSALMLIYKNGKDINYLNEFNINFSEIKKLDILQNIDGNNNDFLCKTLFSFKNISKNLTNLELKVYDEIESKSFEGLNEMLSLKTLKLENVKLKNNTFILKLNNLELLSLKFCENIELSPLICLNMIELFLVCSCIIESESKFMLKFNSLEILEDIESDYNIDYSSLKKLKKLTISIEDFLKLGELFLESISIYSDKGVTYEEEKKMIEKLLLIKTLKSISIDLRRIDDNEISQIIGVNTSVLKLRITWINWADDCILNNLQKKFPNVNTLILNLRFLDYRGETSLKIEENINSKINNFYLFGKGCKKIQFYCQPYENLITIGIDLNNKILDIKNVLPIFNNNCNRTFQSLELFSFKNYENYKLNIIKNVYNNLQYMPNLNEFIFQCANKEIEEELYKNFIRKLLELGIEHITFNIIKNYIIREKYSLEKLKEINSNINCEYIDNYNIAEFK